MTACLDGACGCFNAPFFVFTIFPLIFGALKKK